MQLDFFKKHKSSIKCFQINLICTLVTRFCYFFLFIFAFTFFILFHFVFCIFQTNICITMATCTVVLTWNNFQSNSELFLVLFWLFLILFYFYLFRCVLLFLLRKGSEKRHLYLKLIKKFKSIKSKFSFSNWNFDHFFYSFYRSWGEEHSSHPGSVSSEGS